MKTLLLLWCLVTGDPDGDYRSREAASKRFSALGYLTLPELLLRPTKTLEGTTRVEEALARLGADLWLPLIGTLRGEGDPVYWAQERPLKALTEFGRRLKVPVVALSKDGTPYTYSFVGWLYSCSATGTWEGEVEVALKALRSWGTLQRLQCLKTPEVPWKRN